MSLRNACGVLVAVVVLAACAAPAPPPPEPTIDLAAEEQAIRDASAAWLAATQARDAATIDGFLLADVRTIFDGEVVDGLAAVQMNREEEWAENPDFTIVWTSDDVGVASSGDLGYEHGSWVYDPDGEGDMGEEAGEYLTVWKKIDGQWMVLYDAGTTIEAEEMMEEME
jgi:ketosteroid isomerase-like protein